MGIGRIATRLAWAGLAWLVLAPPTEAWAEKAVAFFTESHVDTKFPLSEIAGKAHSISFRLRLDYPNSMTGNMIGRDSAAGDFYQISKNNTDSGSADRPTLLVQIGPAANPVTGVYANIDNLKDGFEAGKWYHLTITVDSKLKLKLYINGKLMTPRKATLNSPNELQLPPAPWGHGNLRFGKTAPFAQFYGQLAAIAVWDHALSPAEIAQVMKIQKFGAAETASGLRAGWDFEGLPDFGTPTGPGAYWIPRGSAKHVDTAILPGAKTIGAVHQTRLTLPVVGKWAVSQGSDTPYNVPDNSHRGYASFCLDMVRNDGPTEGEPVLAAADGTVVVVRDSTPDRPSVFRPEWTIPDCTPCNGFADGSCGYLSNEVTIKHAPTEYTQYLHLMHGSVPSWIKEKLKNGEPVKRGRMIGLAGRTGAPGPHLHVCMGWATFFLPGPVTASGKDEPVTANPLVAGSCGYKPEVAPAKGMDRTRPFQFSGYFVETGSGEKLVDAGTPQVGQVVRHADTLEAFLVLPGGVAPAMSMHAMHSDKCAQVNGASAENGATISQWDCLAQDNVKWVLADAGDQHYFIKAKHSGKCMQVAAASHDNGAAITQWDCVNQDHHKWKVERLSPSGYYLRAKHSGKCAHVSGGSTANGGAITQWDCFFQDNLRWVFGS